MKYRILFLLLLLIKINGLAQEKRNLGDIIPAKTTLKLNLNGFKMGIEQRIYKNITGQFEIGKNIDGKSITFKPQIRIYRKIFHKNYSYLGLAYFYKHQVTIYNDTVRQLGDNGNFIGYRYPKDFSVSKFVHAITMNTGFFSEANILKQRFIFEFNVGIGIRYKKSSRNGLLSNEEIDLQDAFIIRPQNYENTNGAFKIYPELNLNLSLIVPLLKK